MRSLPAPGMSRVVRRQSTVAFGLSFLDILCCGLGAAVLLLFIIKYGETVAEIDAAGLLVKHITEIQAQIAIKTDEITELKRIADQTQQQIVDRTAQSNARSTISKLQANRLASLLKELQQQRIDLKDARRQLAAAAAERQQTLKHSVPDESKNHLTGIKVGNDHVLILLDSSASMLSSTLIEIIRLRASSIQTQLAAAKWTSARHAALWVVEHLPKDASYQVLTFSDRVHDSHGKLVTSTKPPIWETKSSSALTKTHLEAALANLQPLGPTDLKTALTVATSMKPKPTQIVLITDGYPTLPGKFRLGRLNGCPSVRSGQVPLLSPKCRKSVFDNARLAVKRNLRGTRVDVILYPLEGDSNAVHGYWNFAKEYGGRLLSPVPGWPAS